ncbi:uncharacterized protein TRIADDRAFT_59563 [Trichoplax adhaerens]|uniref:G-protein coupled receptors family 3 profile domain-containing protein n=1 Tax=Trichoplax adhaerens TaxID=10228 RepID=B3S601_TRIAD|nr:hypothetical protein TRIADDRAFT_59563 [Trichoplax adhaerens]EDV21894.1 hypothetical protein TRIADDRAFT_59563 [Trichoplax adhaerens]|eukprot:XP_002115531.1 hypothetical protein TRIADDRAFT_59563 [Trichoplax adhaerens]
MLVNNNSNLLPGIKLGLTIIDSCSSPQLAMSSLSTKLILLPKQQNYDQYNCSGSSTNTHDLYSSGSQVLNRSNTDHSHILGVLAEKSEHITTSLASYTSSLRIIQIGYNSFNPALNNRKFFPYFYRTSPSPDVQTKIIIDVLTRMKWNWICIVLAISNNLDSAVVKFDLQLRQHGICIAYKAILYDKNTTSDFRSVITAIRNQQRTNVIALLGDENIVFRFLKEAENQNLEGKTWIGSYSWMLSSRIKNINSSVIDGVLGAGPNMKRINNFDQYLNHLDLCNNVKNPWFVRAIHQHLQSLRNRRDQANKTSCKIDYHVKQNFAHSFYTVNPISASVIDSVLALAHTLHDQLGCNTSYCPSIDNLHFDSNYQYKYNEFFKKVKFKTFTDEFFYFQSDGSSSLNIDIINFKSVNKNNKSAIIPVSIGSWSEEFGLNINIQMINWNGNKPWYEIPKAQCSDNCQPGSYRVNNPNITVLNQRCCWLCVSCKSQSISTTINSLDCQECTNFTKANKNKTECIDMELQPFSWNSSAIITFYITAALYTIMVFFIWSLMIMYRTTPVVKGSNFVLINILLSFIALDIPSTIIQFLPVSQLICQWQIIVIAFTQLGIMTTVICKTIQIWLIFRNSIGQNSLLSKLTKTKSQVMLIIILLTIFLIFILLLTILRPIAITTRITADNYINLSCDYANSPALTVSLGLSFILSVVSLILAFQVRSFPHNFNEARYIFLATFLLNISAAISVPTYFSLRGEMKQMLGYFSSLGQGLIPLICFFIPKVYIIFYRPELNTRQEAVTSVANFSFNNYRISGKDSIAGEIRESSIN